MSLPRAHKRLLPLRLALPQSVRAPAKCCCQIVPHLFPFRNLRCTSILKEMYMCMCCFCLCMLTYWSDFHWDLIDQGFYLTSLVWIPKPTMNMVRYQWAIETTYEWKEGSCPNLVLSLQDPIICVSKIFLLYMLITFLLLKYIKLCKIIFFTPKQFDSVF